MTEPTKMAMTEEPSNITRVFLWCLPRTVSTSFLKCMTYVPNCQAWYEPYLMSLYFSNSYQYREPIVSQCRDLVGWEGNTATFGSEIQGGYWAADKSHSWVKSQLERPPPEDKKIVFVKDISFAIDGFYEYIPDGFRHSFLIRHPYKIYDSWYRAINRGIPDNSKWMKLTEMPEHLMPKGGLLKEQYDLYQHVKEHYEENPVIINSDDLLADPGRVLKAYCEAVGVPYTDDLLQWKPGRECMDRNWMTAKEQILIQLFFNPHNETFASTGFGKPSEIPAREILSDDVLHYSDLGMKYYEEMYANRLQLTHMVPIMRS